MALSRAQLFEMFMTLGIETTTVEHPPVFTVEQSSGIRLPGADTKNLFLKDDRGRLYLIVAKSETKVDLKALAKRLGSRRLSFARAELLTQTLGVTAGSVTAFAVANDKGNEVAVVIDPALMDADSINCHPLENTATTNIARDELLRFIRATGHDPKVVALTAL